MQLLRKALTAARRHLKRAPHEGKLLGRKRIAELEGLLTSMVPPTHPLFALAFPDRMLCNQYKQQLAALDSAKATAAVEAKGAVAKHASKYGVQWESNSTSTQCRLCGGKWGLLRRRHHCRACGQLVCDDCSSTRIHVAGSDNRKRACDLCAAARRQDAAAEKMGAAAAGTAAADPRELV